MLCTPTTSPCPIDLVAPYCAIPRDHLSLDMNRLGAIPLWGARLRGRTVTQRSKKGSEKVLERVLGKGSQRVLRRGPAMGFTVKKGSEKGSQKGF